jgi:ATP-dependent helicase/nuclease subunit B
MAGYGRAALEELRDVVRELKRGDPLMPVTVLLPNNIAGVVARRFLAQGVGDGNSGVAALFPTTIARLAEQLAAPALHPRRPATAPLTAAAWRSALTRPGVFKDVADHPATVEALVAAGRELRDVDDTALDAISRATGLGPDVVRLYRDAQSRLAPGWYDETGLMHSATAICLRGPQRVREFGPVVLYLPQALSRAETAFVRALVGGGELRAVVGLTGNAKADAPVRRSLERIGVEAPAEPALPVATAVLSASDADDEVRCVVRRVVTALKTTPAHRVAVLYAARNPYARLLHEHLAAAGIAINGPGTRPVHERAVARAVLELLDLPEHDVPRAGLFRVLATVPMRAADGGRVPVSRWERISRAAGVVGGTDWDVRLRHQVAELRIQHERYPDDEWRATDLAEAEGLHRHVADLRDQLQQAKRLTTWRDLAGWLTALIAQHIGAPEELTSLPREEQYAAVALDSAIRALSVLDAVDGPASLAALREALSAQLERALPRVGRFGEGVLLAPMAAAIGLDCDVVFVLGLAEAVFPGRLREDPLLPERAREASGGQLRSSRERLDEQHRHLLAAFAAAPEVVASFPRGDLRTKSRHLPSRWLLPTMRELSGRPGLTATEWDRQPDGWMDTSASFAGSLTNAEQPAHEQEWRVQVAHAGRPLADDVLDAARELVDARASAEFTRFDGNLTAARDGLPDHAAGERPVPPTTLEGFAGCPHSYFIQRLLRVRPLEQPEDVVSISAADIGTLMHDSFDRLVREYDGRLPAHGRPWSDKQRGRLGELAAERAKEFEEQGRTGHERLWQQTLTRIQADLQAMLIADDAWRAERNAAVVASELAFGLDGEAPVSLPLPGGGTLLLAGKADKVDQDSDGRLYVTDIKTGGASSYQGLCEDDPVLGGSKLQLPVYAHAARARHGTPATEVEAAYWFVRKDKGR